MRDEITTPLFPDESISIDPKEVQSFPAVVQVLTYYLKTQGFTIDSDLAGVDRPDIVAGA